jgi:hypothetical protein
MRSFMIGPFLIGFVLLLFAGAVYAQDYTSSQYCDPVCLQRPLGYDCSYHNYAQCWATVSGLGGLCADNPFLGMCTRGTGAAHSPVRRSKNKHAQ